MGSEAEAGRRQREGPSNGGKRNNSSGGGGITLPSLPGPHHSGGGAGGGTPGGRSRSGSPGSPSRLVPMQHPHHSTHLHHHLHHHTHPHHAAHAYASSPLGSPGGGGGGGATPWGAWAPHGTAPGSPGHMASLLFGAAAEPGGSPGSPGRARPGTGASPHGSHMGPHAGSRGAGGHLSGGSGGGGHMGPHGGSHSSGGHMRGASGGSHMGGSGGGAGGRPGTAGDEPLDEYSIDRLLEVPDEAEQGPLFHAGYGMLTEHGLAPFKDKITSRILSLPNIVCRSACGDVFVVGLDNVQDMLHRRRLGPKGMKIYNNVAGRNTDILYDKTGAASAPGSKAGSPPPARKGSGGGGARHRGKHAVEDEDEEGEGEPAEAIEEAVRRMSLLRGSSSMCRHEDLDEEVRSHLEATTEIVEYHRAQLAAGSMSAIAQAERARADAELEARRENAFDMIVNRLLPAKFLHMAHMSVRENDGGAKSIVADMPTDTFAAMQAALAEAAGRPLPPPPPSGEDEGGEGIRGDGGGGGGGDSGVGADAGGAGSSGSTGGGGGAAASSAPAEAEESAEAAALASWGKVKSKVTLVDSELPFLKEWGRATRPKECDAVGWSALLGSAGNDELYIKKNVASTQGTTVYCLKCQEMGVVPSSQVVQQLQCETSNMGHCQLGRAGARALRHALIANSAITDLNLSDNGFDSHAIAEIIAGLAAGTLAAPRTTVRKKDDPKCAGLDGMRTTVKPRDLVVQMVPEAVRSHHMAEPGQEDAPSGASGASFSPRDGDAALPASSSTSVAPAAATAVPPVKKSGTGGKLALHAGNHVTKVTSVDFSENPFGVNGAKVFATVLDPRLTLTQFLRSVMLSKCSIPEAGGAAIARAIANGNMVLHTLNMSNNSLGNRTAAAFGALLPSNKYLTDLDLSWNQIRAEGVSLLCDGLEENGHLRKLNLSWNGLEDVGVKRIGEMLGRNRGLRHLDLTNTRMGSGAALLVADGIISNDVLEELILNGNAVGDVGARYLMNALKNNNSLQYLGLQGTNMTSGARNHDTGADFNPLSPDGNYALNLADSADRTIAWQLCKLDCESEGDLMKAIKMDGRNIPNCKSANWPESLQTRGMLTFDFITHRVRKFVQVMEQKKFQALHAQLVSRSMADKEKLALVEVMAPFTYLNCHQVATLLACFAPMSNELVEAAATLFTRASDLEDNLDQLTFAMQERDMRSLHDKLGWYSYLRFCNPTGHYEFSLSMPAHRHLATRLKDVAIAEPPNLPSGLNNNWVNLVHDLYTDTMKVYQNYGAPESWKSMVPMQGVLSFDFVSGAVPPEDAAPISDEQLMEFLVNGVGIAVDPLTGVLVPETDHEKADMQIAMLRQEVGAHLFVTCAQCVSVMDCFNAAPQRVEVFVIFFNFILDRNNMAYVLYAMKPLEQAVTLWRLGPANLFDRAHPSAHYILDCSNPSHEIVARKLIDIANAQPDFTNIWNLRLRGKRRSVTENKNMWGSFTVENNCPFLEFDFIGPDGYLLGGKTAEEFDAMGKGEKNELITRIAKRMELSRNKALFGYGKDAALWEARPSWQSNAELFRAQQNKPPWKSGWDRLGRILFRQDLSSGDIDGDCALEDIFDEHADDENEMSIDAFEALLKDCGYTRSEIFYHWRDLFYAVARPSATDATAAASGEGPEPRPASRSLNTSASGAVRQSLSQSSRSASTSVSGAVHNLPSQSGANASTPVSGAVRNLPSQSGANAGTSVSGAVRNSPSQTTREKNWSAAGDGERPASAAVASVVMDYTAFLNVFMTEPDPAVMWRALPPANVATTASERRRPSNGDGHRSSNGDGRRQSNGAKGEVAAEGSKAKVGKAGKK
ncbi:hypothetical protein FOA52_010932 [Chlamydomonas sp. UWO 241]|nr:hypothetical protein FOA52_010932 [Chlamydomonas sp. UWO 241]